MRSFKGLYARLFICVRGRLLSGVGRLATGSVLTFPVALLSASFTFRLERRPRCGLLLRGERQLLLRCCSCCSKLLLLL